MNQRKTFDGEEAMRRLLRHAYKLEVGTIDAEEIQTQYHRQAVDDLNTLAGDINVIAEQFADAYGADIEFDFDIDISEFADPGDRDSGRHRSASTSTSVNSRRGTMSRDSRREVLEEHEDVFRRIAESDLPADIRRRCGRRPLEELERIRAEAEDSGSSTDEA